MNRTKPAETKLVICVWHPFTWWRPQPVMAEAIRKRWPEMSVVHLPDYDRLPEELPDTDIFVGNSLRAKQLKDAKKLKWLHSTAAGVAQLMYPELRDSGILVTNPSGVFSVPMAEHTMGLILALARNFPDSVRQQELAHWSQQDLWDKARLDANWRSVRKPSKCAFGERRAPGTPITRMSREFSPQQNCTRRCRK